MAAATKNKINLEALRKLRKLKQAQILAEAEYQTAASALQSATARELHAVGAPLETSIVCLQCGTVRGVNPRKAQQAPCPVCEPESKPKE